MERLIGALEDRNRLHLVLGALTLGYDLSLRSDG